MTPICAKQDSETNVYIKDIVLLGKKKFGYISKWIV